MDSVFYEKLERLEKKIDEIEESLDKKEANLNQFDCSDCDFQHIEEWQLPCIKCSRLYKDYYRRTENESEQ